MHSVSRDLRRRSAPAGAVVVFGAIALLASCRAKFTGPYPCAAGYASCIEPQNDQCETNTDTDGLHCGACGHACPLGAVCTSGACGPPAMILANVQTGSQTAIAVNSSAVFWESSSGIQRVSASGGQITTVAADVYTCGASASFAVDDRSVYYWTNSIVGQGAAGALVKRSLADGTRTVLMSSNGNVTSCPSILADAANVYVASSAMSGPQTTIAVTKVPIDGSPGTTLGTVQTNGGGINGMALSPNAIIFAGYSTSGPPTLRLLPIAGGPSTTLSVGNAYYNAFAADATSAYLVGSGCPCTNNSNGGSYSGPPMGNVTRIALDGTSSTVLAEFFGQVGGVAVDATDVYWSTDSTLWKVPIGGGDPTPIAGNLSSGNATVQCNGCSGSSNSEMPVAVGGGNVYVVAPTAGAILEVPK